MKTKALLAFAVLLSVHTAVGAQDLWGIFPTSIQAEPSGEADLAKQLANPIASLISLPIQSNYDFGIGPGDGTKWTTNIQPVIPFELNQHWNLISRTILMM